jgi:AraC-like DNA-binding protein
MTDFACENDTSASLYRQAAGHFTVETRGNNLQVVASIPWQTVHAVSGMLALAFSRMGDALDDRFVHEERVEVARRNLRDEAAIRKADFKRIGRLAARNVRRRAMQGIERTDAIAEIAYQVGFQPASVEIAMSIHERTAKVRAKRLRDAVLVRFAAEGRSNREIGDALGLAPSYAGKLVRQALNAREIKGAANDNN